MKNIIKNKEYIVLILSVVFMSLFSYLYDLSKDKPDKEQITKKTTLDDSSRALKIKKTDLPFKSVLPEAVVTYPEAVNKLVAVNDNDADNKQLTNETIAVKETQTDINEFLTVDDVNKFLLDPIYKANSEFLPLIEKLKEDPKLRQEWLDWLSLAENKNVKNGTELVLAALPIEDLVGFASKSLKHGSKHLLEHTVSALSRRNDLDLVESGLKDDVVNLLTDERVNRYAKIDAIKVLSERPELYVDHERTQVTQVVEQQLLSEDLGLRAKAVNAIIKLDANNNNIEPAVLSGIAHQDIQTRKKSLDRMDYQLELGLELSNEAVASIHHQVLSDVSGEIKFAEGEKERYAETAAYILGNLNLTESQIYEMQEAGLPYIDYTKGDEPSENTSENDSKEQT